jgi:hypothetical protein
VSRIQEIVGKVPDRGRIVIVVYSSSVGALEWMSEKTSRRRDLEMDAVVALCLNSPRSRGLAR